MSKTSGILLPIFSLPSEYSIGTLGIEARDFVDFLVASGQSVWQILPVGPTLYEEYNSPYKTMSPFAGNPLLISLVDLTEKGLLKESEIEILKRENSRKIDYKFLTENKNLLLHRAAKRGLSEKSKDYLSFLEENKEWIFEYSKYICVRMMNAKNQVFESKTFESFQEEVMFIQYLFFIQFSKIKSYANSKNISLFGDIPFFEAFDSHRVYFHRENFKLNEDGSPYKVAGVPPDQFSDKGQIWGNPVYDFQNSEKDNFKFIYDKFAFALQCYDIIRLDHFRGFESYYEIDHSSQDAINGTWVKAPGRQLVDLLNKSFDRERIVAENLGYITNEVSELMNYSGFYSMSVLQFAFEDQSEENLYLPENQEEKNCFYTGTHDNQTAKSFIESNRENELLNKKLNDFSGKNEVYSFISYAMSAKSNRFIAPMSDYLYLGEEGRINTPGTVEKNWKIMYKKDDFNDKLAENIFDLCKKHKRLL